MSKRSEKQRLHEFLHPQPVSMEDILRSENPVYEVNRRLLHCPDDILTPIEREFWEASYFLASALNDGLDGALLSSAGDPFPRVLAFLRRSKAHQVVAVLGEVERLFPGGVPHEQEARADRVEALWEEPGDPLGALTTEFYRHEGIYDDALLQFIRDNGTDFPWVSSPLLTQVTRGGI